MKNIVLNADFRKKIAEIIIYYRKKNNLTQGELSEKSGIDRPKISNIEKENFNDINLSTLTKLFDALNIPINFGESKYIEQKNFEQENEFNLYQNIKDKSFSEIIKELDLIKTENASLKKNADNNLLKRIEKLEKAAARCDELEIQNQNLLKIITDVEAGIIRVTQIKKYIENSKLKY